MATKADKPISANKLITDIKREYGENTFNKHIKLFEGSLAQNNKKEINTYAKQLQKAIQNYCTKHKRVVNRKIDNALQAAYEDNGVQNKSSERGLLPGAAAKSSLQPTSKKITLQEKGTGSNPTIDKQNECLEWLVSTLFELESSEGSFTISQCPAEVDGSRTVIEKISGRLREIQRSNKRLTALRDAIQQGTPITESSKSTEPDVINDIKTEIQKKFQSFSQLELIRKEISKLKAAVENESYIDQSKTKGREPVSDDFKEMKRLLEERRIQHQKTSGELDDIKKEISKLKNAVEKKTYDGKSVKKGEIFDDIRTIQFLLERKQTPDKKTQQEDVLKQLKKLSDDVQNEKYDTKEKGLDVIKKIRETLEQRQEQNKKDSSRIEQLEKQIEDIEQEVTNIFLHICGEDKENALRTSFKKKKDHSSLSFVQLMIMDVKQEVDKIDNDAKTLDRELTSSTDAIVKSMSELHKSLTGFETAHVEMKTSKSRLEAVQKLLKQSKSEICIIMQTIDELHTLIQKRDGTCQANTANGRCQEAIGVIKKLLEERKSVAELISISKNDLPVIYQTLKSIGFKEVSAPQLPQNTNLEKVKNYIVVIKTCVTATAENFGEMFVRQHDVRVALQDMFENVTNEKYETTLPKDKKGQTTVKQSKKPISTETPKELDFTVIIADMESRITEKKERLESKNSRQGEELEKSNLKLKRLTHDLMETSETLDQTEKARVELLNRLSKVAGAKMVDGNPNIADLSDTNRPTKLGERFSELYDNEWTDAFDIVSKSGKDEESTIKILIDILFEAYRFCKDVSETQVVVLRNTLLCPVQKMDSSHVSDETKLESIQAKMVADLRKQTAAESMKDLKRHFEKEKATVACIRLCPKYVDACIELSWLMCLQSPPVFIETKFDKKGKFDTNVYKAYSKSGKKYEFQVWPALYLHERGPLLSKGVAQGKK